MISQQAIIDKDAIIGKDVRIGPFSIIGEGVEIGDGCTIESHVVIKGPTQIGKQNHIFQFSSVGEIPQDKKYDGRASGLSIGDNNVIRECSTIHRGTEQAGGITKLGSNNLFMVGSHVAHDCIIGNHVIFANNASVAGHVTVGDYASLGGMVGVHQFCSIGAHSFMAGGTILFKDVPPYVTVSGSPAQAHGLNTIGLERRGFSSESIAALRRAYKIIFVKGHTIQDAIGELTSMAHDHAEVQLFIDFFEQSTRGIVR